ncbi:hypothetical protein W04_2203 [Pseudoalteromonas sp. SW0106-04]|nr:hypothetical protein W04_2203 [Pseudoalteromonas sp. SW0106-04]
MLALDKFANESLEFNRITGFEERDWVFINMLYELTENGVFNEKIPILCSINFGFSIVIRQRDKN